MAKADRDGHVYTETVDRELRRAWREPARTILRRYADDHGGDVIRVRPPTKKELEETRLKCNDGRILYEAEMVGADYVVTYDKIFRKRGDGYKGGDEQGAERGGEEDLRGHPGG